MLVEKVSYDINWKAFKRGYSFFIPCLDPVRAKQEILRTTKRFKIPVVMKVIIIEGIRGLRVWHL
jgi:tRNA A37 threonylcarbamoyladenosine dehydratase